MLLGSGHVQMYLHDYACFRCLFQYTFSTPAAAERHRTPARPQDHATHAPHGSTRCIIAERNPPGDGLNPPGDGLLGPRERSGSPGEGGVSNIFGGVSLPRFLSCPLFEVSIAWKAFFSGRLITPHRVIFFLYARVFWLSGNRSVVRASPTVDALFLFVVIRVLVLILFLLFFLVRHLCCCCFCLERRPGGLVVNLEYHD